MIRLQLTGSNRTEINVAVQALQASPRLLITRDEGAKQGRRSLNRSLHACVIARPTRPHPRARLIAEAILAELTATHGQEQAVDLLAEVVTLLLIYGRTAARKK